MSYRVMLHHMIKGKKIFDLHDDPLAREQELDSLWEQGWKDRTTIRAELEADEAQRAESRAELGPISTSKNSIDNMSKDELEAYAMENFGVNLDKRKSVAKLQAEVRALENDNG